APIRRILDSSTDAVFAQDSGRDTGYLFHRNQSAMRAVRFDARKGEVLGEPFVVLENPGTGRLPLTASVPARVVVWREAAAGGAGRTEIVAWDRGGHRIATVDAGASGAHTELSPDG